MVYYWISAIGLCFILKYGSILERFRTFTSSVFPMLGKLYKCCLCMGFWVGISMIPFLVKIEGYSYEIVFFPFSCSAICWFADCLITLINTLNYDIEKNH
jgi:hypothetical protein